MRAAVRYILTKAYITRPIAEVALSISDEILPANPINPRLCFHAPYSGHLPVSDYGTIDYETPYDGFSRQPGIDDFALTVVAAPFIPYLHLREGYE